MKKKIEFNFKFKGKRNYIHGTDLFNFSIKFLENERFDEISNIDMSFHKIVKKQMSGYLFSEKEFSIVKGYSFIFSFYHKNLKYYICLNENNTDVEERYDYPEEKIVDLSKFNLIDKSFLLKESISYTIIEKMVALNKGLLENLFPEAQGKWYFTRLQLENNINNLDFKELKVQLKRNMNFKITKSIVYLDNEKIGYIYFSLN